MVRHNPQLLELLLDPEQVSIQERVISTPLSTEITLTVIQLNTEPGQTVIHLDAETDSTLDSLDHVVRTQEEFMRVPFPRQFVAVLVADATPHRAGGGPRGIVTICRPSAIMGLR